MSLLLLAISFLVSGLSNLAAKALVETGLQNYRDTYVLAAQVTSMTLGSLVLLLTRTKTQPSDGKMGFTMGLFCGLSWITVVAVLAQLPGIVAFPVRNIGSLILTAGVSMVAWQERLSRSQWAALVLAVIAIWLLF